MPANLTPEYHAAEARFRAASSAEEKLAALEDMLRFMPKHKGTAKMQADVKARISKLRRQPKKQTGARGAGMVVPKGGAGQIALVGPPNSGKSSLVARLTHADPEVAAYPFTTRAPLPGMMPFEDVAFQLVDLPPLAPEHVEPWVYDIIRRADLAWLVVSIDNALEGAEQTEGLLEARHIGLYPAGEAAPEAGEQRLVQCPALFVVTGMDAPNAEAELATLAELLPRPWPLWAIASPDGRGTEALGRATFDALAVMRVYTKQPGKPADRDKPFTLHRGATVGELARTIHKDMATRFRFARIWGPSAFDGQTVHEEHVLADGDIVEIHL